MGFRGFESLSLLQPPKRFSFASLTRTRIRIKHLILPFKGDPPAGGEGCVLLFLCFAKTLFLSSFKITKPNCTSNWALYVDMGLSFLTKHHKFQNFNIRYITFYTVLIRVIIIFQFTINSNFATFL